MSDPYDAYLQEWLEQRHLDEVARTKDKRREAIIEYLMTQGTVTIDNQSGNLYLWGASSEKPAITVTFHASQESTVQKIDEFVNANRRGEL